MQKLVLIWACMSFCLLSGFALAEEAPAQSNEVDTRSKEMGMLSQELEQLRLDQSTLVKMKEQASQEIQGAPELAAQIRAEIGRLEGESEPTDVPSDLERVESVIQLLEIQVKALQLSLNDVMGRIGEQQALPTVARQEVTSARSKAVELQAKVNQLDSKSDSSSISTLRLAVLKTSLENIELRKSLAQFKLEGYQKLLDLYAVNRDFLMLRLDIIKSALTLLREKRDEIRLHQADKAQQKTTQATLAQKQEPNWVAEQRNINKKLTQQLVDVTEKLNESNEALVEGQQVLQEIRYRFEVAKQQLELTEYYQNVDDLLFRQRQTLQVKIRELESKDQLSIAISKARLDQFQLDEQLQRVRTETARQQKLDSLLVGNKVTKKNEVEVRESLMSIMGQRQVLLAQLAGVQAEYVVSLTNLELSTQEQLVARRQFYELLNKELFWRRSAAPLNLEWFALLPSSIFWFIQSHDWVGIVSIWLRQLVAPIYPLLVLLPLFGFYWWGRKGLLKRLVRVKAKVGDVKKDSFRYTLEAFLITIYLALLAPMICVVLAMPLITSKEASLFVDGAGKALWVLSGWLFLFELLRHICRSDGLALNHFAWRESAVRAVLRWMPYLYAQLPWAFIYVLVWREGDDFHAGIVGRAAFFMVVSFFMYFCFRLFRPSSGVTQLGRGNNHWYQRWNKSVFVAMMVVPASLMILSVRGYSFSAMEIMLLIYNTVGLAFMVFILDQVVNRWFAVAERKLAYKRAIEKRDALRKAKEQTEAAKSGGDVIPELEIPQLDVATISEQNRALLGVLSFTLFAVLTAQIWEDFFVAVQGFQDFVLWTYTVSSEFGAEENTVTLATLLYVLISMLVIYVGVKNLPGLIEVSILERFAIDSGIRFAVTTMARYVVIVAGVMVVSPMIGLDWSKLGWLVAALGVGLGFGLQEIFANFISGLIILFERPIRIGDTVTINNLSGTVSQIRMRATTITDWDQKELIIPNKTFVTSQFINWTLSDSTTRIVVKVGVAYGSDTKLVTETLLKIADQNQTILKEPDPSALFLGFGASSLDFELRVFVSSFAQRMPLIHRLHMDIDQRFRELGVSIAFPQLDVHVKDRPNSAS